MNFRQIPVMGTNCYLIWDEHTLNAVCIDPGYAGRKIAKEIKNLGLHLQYIFLTHSHADHVSGIDDMCNEFDENPVIYMSKAELLYEDFPFKKQWGFGCPRRYWEEHLMVVVDSMKFEVIHTPGHSLGSVCVIVDNLLISGDLLSIDSIGRVDFIGSNAEDMFSSLEKFLHHPDSLVVLPGHDVITTIKNIKNSNPYVKRILRQ